MGEGDVGCVVPGTRRLLTGPREAAGRPGAGWGQALGGGEAAPVGAPLSGSPEPGPERVRRHRPARVPGLWWGFLGCVSLWESRPLPAESLTGQPGLNGTPPRTFVLGWALRTAPEQ